jgi:hypothetical protein
VVDQFNLVVADMAASVAFDRLIGFEIPDGDEPWDQHHRSAAVPGGIDLDLDSSGATAIDGGVSALTGYSIITADSLSEATEAAKECPVLVVGGSVEVYEATPIG